MYKNEATVFLLQSKKYFENPKIYEIENFFSLTKA